MGMDVGRYTHSPLLPPSPVFRAQLLESHLAQLIEQAPDPHIKDGIVTSFDPSTKASAAAVLPRPPRREVKVPLGHLLMTRWSVVFLMGSSNGSSYYW